MGSVAKVEFAVFAALFVLAALWVVKSGGAGGAGAAAGKAAGDAAAGVVLGIGDSLGIPRTDMTECQKALAEGRTWDASFACPALTFIKGVFSPPAVSTADGNFTYLPDFGVAPGTAW